MPVNDSTHRNRVLFLETPAVKDVNYTVFEGLEMLSINDKTAENPTSLMSLDRFLSDQYVPVPNSGISIKIDEIDNNGTDVTKYRAWASEHRLPFSVDSYAERTYESAVDFVFGSSSVSSTEDVFTGADGEKISNMFRDLALRSAKYYANILAYKTENDEGLTLGSGCGDTEGTKDHLTITKKYYINRRGELGEARSVYYHLDSSARDGEWSNWDLAQQCDELEKTVEIDKNGKGRFNGVTIINPYSCYWSIFDERRHALGSPYDLNLNKKKYDTTLVGKPEPFKPAGDFVDSVYIEDEGNDGITDVAHAWWWDQNDMRPGADGGLRVDKRSSYTASMLKYFDPIWRKAEANTYSYTAPYAPLEVFVDNCGEVEEGDKLFAISTDNGVKTFTAEMDGYVTYLGGNLYLRVEENRPSSCE